MHAKIADGGWNSPREKLTGKKAFQGRGVKAASFPARFRISHFGHDNLTSD